MEFKPYPKVPRLSREVVITEKIDGTNASVFIEELGENGAGKLAVLSGAPYLVRAGSRTRWITPEDDNYGFARWAYDHADELVKLGPGHHFGEWWGGGIQRSYGLSEKRFSLFNTGRWREHGFWEEGYELAPLCCHVVPVLWKGSFDLMAVELVMETLVLRGSRAAPGFMDPEGIMVYHTAASQVFKKTVKGDEAGKSWEGHVAKPPKVQVPRDKSKGGRRKTDVPVLIERRIPRV